MAHVCVHSMVLTNVLNSLGSDDYSRQILRFWLQTGDRKSC